MTRDAAVAAFAAYAIVCLIMAALVAMGVLP